MSVDGVGIWAYAVLRAQQAEDRIAGLRGVAGEPVRAVFAADLAAAVGTVGLDEFGDLALRRNLEDLDWLSDKARAHDAVVSGIARFGPVIPVRMATVYFDDDRVRQVLTNRHDAFDAVLHRVSGRAELGVKGYADPKGIAVQENQSADSGSGRRSGTAYLARRRRELASEEEGDRFAAGEADRIHRTLLRCAVDGKRKPALDKSLSNRAGWTVLNGTYLVDEGLVDLFMETVTALEKTTARITLEVTGPWPPYSFAGDVEAS